jgi:methionyl-tRNA formyltransferase
LLGKALDKQRAERGAEAQLPIFTPTTTTGDGKAKAAELDKEALPRALKKLVDEKGYTTSVSDKSGRLTPEGRLATQPYVQEKLRKKYEGLLTAKDTQTRRKRLAQSKRATNPLHKAVRKTQGDVAGLSAAVRRGGGLAEILKREKGELARRIQTKGGGSILKALRNTGL